MILRPDQTILDNMNVLGIETSCDETALAILSGGEGSHPPKLLAEVVSSQCEIHAQYGGVVPELASREHLKNLPILLDLVLKQADLSLDEISLIGVTRGPGLKGCLLMGVGFAKGISVARDIPILDINHIEGHLLAPKLDNPELSFPYLALIVSGGHTEIQIVHDVGEYTLVARTIDDAAGEAFDKSANLLGFEYPGGARLAALADAHGEKCFELPRVMREAEGFSFSGLKTAIALLVKRELGEWKEDRADENQKKIRADICFAVQEAIVDALTFKLRKACSETNIQNIVVTGGVAANKRLRAEVEKLAPGRAYFPIPAHCIDNAAMIAYCTLLRYHEGTSAGLDLDVLARWPVEQLTPAGAP